MAGRRSFIVCGESEEELHVGLLCEHEINPYCLKLWRWGMGRLLEQLNLLTPTNISSNLYSGPTVEGIARKGMSFRSLNMFKNTHLDVKCLRQNQTRAN